MAELWRELILRDSPELAGCLVLSRVSISKKTGRMTVAQMAEQLSGNAARIFGMYPKKGCIAEGSDADIVIFDPKAERTISWRTNAHNCDNSPYEGMRTVGAARDVIVNGVLAVQNGTLVQEGAGRYVFRGRSQRPNR